MARLEFRGAVVVPHRSMRGKKSIERHGRQWWVSDVVYSLMLTDYGAMVRSLTVVEEKR
jgi:hypothetical protein